MISADDSVELIRIWTDRGWLRPLDQAFAQFLSRHEPGASALVIMAAALAGHQLGRGHICLDICAAVSDPDAVLSLPPEGETGEEMPPKPSEVLGELTRDLWIEALEASSLVGGDKGNSPLVLNQGRVYLRRFWRYTRQVAQAVLIRTGDALAVPGDIQVRLDTLFSDLRTPGEKEKKEVHWQSVAAAVAAASTFCVISGGPGTGKTTTVVQILALLQEFSMARGRPLRIRLAAPTGKAAARLTESIGKTVDRLPSDLREKMPAKVTTLHRLLGTRPDSRYFIHNPNNKLHVDLLVVDEASMIDLEMMDALLGALPEKARLILLGDKDQLASVEAGSVLGDICVNAARPCYRPATLDRLRDATGFDLSDFEGPGTDLDQHIVVLRKSHRFHGNSGIGALARAVNQGDVTGVNEVWDQGFSDISRLMIGSDRDRIFRRLVLDGNPDAFTASPGPCGYRRYLTTMAKGPQGRQSETEWLRAVISEFNRFQVLTPLRRGDLGVEGLNRSTAQILHGAGLIPATRGWYPGRPVMVTRNDYSLGLMNGDIGIAVEVRDDRSTDPARVLRVVFPMADRSLKQVLPSRLEAVETVFAMTVHKSQGSEFDHTVLILPGTMSPLMTRELVYTGITRARSFFTLAGPAPKILSRAVTQRTHRASGLGDLLGSGMII